MAHDAHLPVTGAWTSDQPAAFRRFFTFATDRPFILDGGGQLRDVTIAYETWGQLDDSRRNAVLLCHAWTGDAHASGPTAPGQPTMGWWEGMIGPGLPIDTDRFFVVCTNVLGGCQGSTGPASLHPDDGRPYGSRFPEITIRDMVRAQERLTHHLGIDSWAAVIGGSMGGMQVLEWAITYPHMVRSIAPIATCMQATAQQIAWGAIGRRSIRLDPKWQGGDYYDAAPGDGPWEGLAVARMVAQVTFRSDNAFTRKFGRELVDNDPLQRFNVESYLDYHGEQLVKRFDANSYMVIGKAMDLHDVGRGRNGVESAMSRIKVPTLTMGIWSDILYPEYQQHDIREMLESKGTRCDYLAIDSPEGHDAFLICKDQVGQALGPFLDRAIKE